MIGSTSLRSVSLKIEQNFIWCAKKVNCSFFEFIKKIKDFVLSFFKKNDLPLKKWKEKSMDFLRPKNLEETPKKIEKEKKIVEENEDFSQIFLRTCEKMKRKREKNKEMIEFVKSRFEN